MTIDMEKRAGIERRKSSSINVRSLIYAGNRMLIRRQEDRKRLFFLDRYSPKLFVAIVAILFLCAIDALLTLFLIGHGAYEVNPILAYLLEVGPYTFFIPKYALTMTAAICLLSFRNIDIWHFNISTHLLLYPVAGIYLAVVVWELYLLSHVTI